MTFHTSRNHTFLLEILISLLLFSLLLVVSLRLIAKSHLLTRDARDLQMAVSLAAGAASLYESGDGSFSTLLSAYPTLHYEENGLITFLDENGRECGEDDFSYALCIADAYDPDALMNAVSISVLNEDGEELYAIDAACLTRLTAGDGEVSP